MKVDPAGISGSLRTPNCTVIWYSLPMIAGGMMSFLISNYLMKYSTDRLGISAAVMGSLFFISRIWDAVNDPFVGFMSDKTGSATGPVRGRRKIWILISAVPLSLLFVFLWLPPGSLSNQLKIIWVGAGMILFFTALTGLYVPHYSLGAELAVNRDENNRIYGIRALFENIGNFIAVPVIAIVTAATLPAQAVFIVIGLFALLSVLVMVRKVDEPDKKNTGTIKLTEAFSNVFTNRRAAVVLTAGFFSQFAATSIMIFALYYAHYILMNESYGSLIIGIFMLTATLSIPLWIFFSKKRSKRKLWISAKAVLTVFFIVPFFVDRGSNQINLFIIAGVALVSGAAAGLVLIMNPSMLADTIRFDRDLSGSSREGAYFSVFTFINKSSMGVAGMVSGWLLAFGGFVPNAGQSDSALTAIKAGFSLVPAAAFSLGIIALLFYRRGVNDRKD